MVGRNVMNGVYAGFAAGVVSGIALWVLALLPSMGELVGQRTDMMGFLVHMGGCVVISALFGLLFGALVHGVGSGIFFGVLYGGLWWFLGPMTLLPYATGYGWGVNWTSAAATSMFPSLIGFLIYGLVLGIVFGALWRAHEDIVVTERRVVIEKTVTYP